MTNTCIIVDSSNQKDKSLRNAVSIITDFHAQHYKLVGKPKPRLEFGDNIHDFLFCLVGPQPAAWLRLINMPDHLLIDHIFVSEACRGNGLAGDLMSFALSQPFDQFRLVVEKHNPFVVVLLRFYTKHGFRIYSETSDEYHLSLLRASIDPSSPPNHSSPFVPSLALDGDRVGRFTTGGVQVVTGLGGVKCSCGDTKSWGENTLLT